MAERLVDVKRSGGAILHVYPVTIPAEIVSDADYEKKALMAAAYDQVVPTAELDSLTAGIHISRGGSLSQFGDNRGILTQTKLGLDQVVRERAYLLWEQEGRQIGRAEEYWHRAHEQHLRERAYLLWEQENCPEGRADEIWQRTCEFERF
jgi:hypothetical protein